MSDIEQAVEDIVTEVVEQEVAEEVAEETPPVIVLTEPVPNVDATEALALANEVREIAQDEAQQAAQDAATVAVQVVSEELATNYMTKDEVQALVHDAVTAAVAATAAVQATPALVEQDEVPAPGSDHFWYRKRWFNK